MNEQDRPSPTQAGKEAELSRRQFLVMLSVGLGAFASALVGLPIIGFVLSPLIRKPNEVWRTVGKMTDFPVGTTTQVTFLDPSPLAWAGVAAKTAAWLRRDSEQQFTAFSVNCTHLGCPVRWLPKSDLFMCPCHGGVYDRSGNVVAGPPPKPLVQYPVRIQNGDIQVRTSQIPIG